MNPEWIPPLEEALFSAGARDVWTTQIGMKKGRPAITISALVDHERRDAVAQAIVRESTSIGVRWYEVERAALARSIVTVETALGAIACKVAKSGDLVMNVAPEYEVCRRIASERGVPVKAVYQAALAAYWGKR